MWFPRLLFWAQTRHRAMVVVSSSTTARAPSAARGPDNGPVTDIAELLMTRRRWARHRDIARARRWSSTSRWRPTTSQGHFLQRLDPGTTPTGGRSWNPRARGRPMRLLEPPRSNATRVSSAKKGHALPVVVLSTVRDVWTRGRRNTTRIRRAVAKKTPQQGTEPLRHRRTAAAPAIEPRLRCVGARTTPRDPTRSAMTAAERSVNASVKAGGAPPCLARMSPGSARTPTASSARKRWRRPQETLRPCTTPSGSSFGPPAGLLGELAPGARDRLLRRRKFRRTPATTDRRPAPPRV